MIEKIIGFILFFIGIFFYGFLRGKKNQKNENIIKNYDNLWKNNQIRKEVDKDIDNMSFSDKSDFLFREKGNDDNK